MSYGNVEGGQLTHPWGYGVGWVGHRILLKEVKLILRGPVRILPGDEDGERRAFPGRGTGTGKGTVLWSLHLWGNFQM